MDEGLFQLVFILIIFIAAIVDALARGRKKRRRMEEMEREEEGAAAGTEAPPRPEPGWEAPRPEPTGEASGRDEEAVGEEERETADRMVPEDLWAVLTGEEPRRGTPAPSREDPREPPARTRSEEGAGAPPVPTRTDPDPPRRPHIPEPAPQDRYREGRERPVPERRPREGRRERPDRPRPRGTPPSDVKLPPAPDVGWEDVPDISEGEISDGPEIGPPGARRGRGRPARKERRPRTPASRYAEPLRAGGRESLRRAVVLREVLDRPLSLRGDDGGWDGEER